MHNSMYYGEIVARISGHLTQKPEYILRINQTLNTSNERETESIWTICVDAGRVFDRLEDLSGEHFINWMDAVDHYSDEVLNYLLSGRKPFIVDMISMAARSIESNRIRVQNIRVS